MANPFETKFDSTCGGCDDVVPEGDYMYAHDGFFCEECAEDMKIVCKCGQKKKPDFEKCYDCFNNEKEEKKSESNQNKATWDNERKKWV